MALAEESPGDHKDAVGGSAQRRLDHDPHDHDNCMSIVLVIMMLVIMTIRRVENGELDASMVAGATIVVFCAPRLPLRLEPLC
jgi:hypothetical protein